MKKGGGKQKGGNFEREIAKFLSCWMGGNKKDLWIWRSPGSGSVATVGLYKDATGDLVAINENAKPLMNYFSIELKCGYPDASFDNIFKNNKNDDLKNFWDQCTRDAIKANKQPLLIFKKDRFPIIVGISEYFYDLLIKYYSKSTNKQLLYEPFIKIQFSMKNDCLLQPIIYFDFNTFFELIKYKELQEIIKYGSN